MLSRTLLLFLIGLFGLLPLHAATFCVNTTGGLAAALSTASTNAQDNVIKVQSGVYFTPGSGFKYQRVNGDYDLDIEGSWNVGCTAQSKDAGDTVLDGQSDHAVLGTSVFNGPGAVTVRYFTLIHGAGHQNGGSAFYAVMSDGELRVENCQMLLNTTDVVDSGYQGDVVVYLYTSTGAVYFRNNVVTGNIVPKNDTVISIEIFNLVKTFVPVVFTGNTIADNFYATDTNDPALLTVSPLGIYKLSNNILWNNGPVFRTNNHVHPLLLNNDIDQVNAEPDPDSLGNLNVDPQFINPFNYRLRETSPLFNRGNTLPPGGNAAVDMDGNPRFLFGAIDIGAYEEQVYPDKIFISSFEND